MNNFPQNPMLIHKIQDSILDLPGYDMLTIATKRGVYPNPESAISLIVSCRTDNPRMAKEVFGEPLLQMIDEYNEGKQTENDIPPELFHQPGVFGYMGDN